MSRSKAFQMVRTVHALVMVGASGFALATVIGFGIGLLRNWDSEGFPAWMGYGLIAIAIVMLEAAIEVLVRYAKQVWALVQDRQSWAVKK